jgi:hypothetical protein
VCRPRPWPHRVLARTRLVVVGRVPVFAPLPHVSAGVQETIGTCARRTDADRVVAGVAPLAPEDPALRSRLLVPPRELAAVGPPRGLLPLRLRREPRPRPFAIRPGFVPQHEERSYPDTVQAGRVSAGAAAKQRRARSSSVPRPPVAA